ncbi:adenosylcobinamide-GDP ribazoletransferase [Lysinibacillus sp. 54212]|uniref:adenosylcobinamide-GDP ribazoletransferase n=1 Tax=Lysinibacillus sp. 54212 TaxID=3119829 RepID=UPI002FCA4BD9
MGLRTGFTGILLALQFFTSLPIKFQLPITRMTATAMYGAIPLLGIGMGSILAGIIVLNNSYLQFSSLFIAILLVVAHFIMTGGLHMDGVVDTGDAFFSYRDKERRLEILDDPRVGAFGAMTLVIFVLLKVAVLYELLLHSIPIYYFIVLPFMARLSILLYFLTMKTFKNKGIAAYFKERVHARKLWLALIIYSLSLIAVSLFLQQLIWLVLFVVMLLFVAIYRYWTKKNFGGMSGDLVGACFEGTELLLWFTLLLFI